MRTNRVAPFVTFLLATAVLVILASCSFSRTDMLELASSQPDIRIISEDPNPYSFNMVELYDTKTKKYYIENIGSRTLSVTKLYTSDSENTEFSIDATETQSDLEPGQSTQFRVYYKPSIEQSSSIDLLIESDDPDQGLYALSVSGTGVWHGGVPPMIMVMQDSSSVDIDSMAHDFGPVDVGSRASIDFTIINHSNADHDLAVSSIAFKDGDTTHFNRIGDDLPRNIPHDVPDNYMYFTVEFVPESGQIAPTQAYAVEVEIISDDPDYGSFSFWVQGTGIAEQNIRVLDGLNEVPNDGSSVNTIDFGSVEHTMDLLTKTLTVQNTGTAPLNISSISISDPEPLPNFSFTGTIPIQILPGNSTGIDITFEPVSRTGSLYADVDIISDDPDESPYEFRVIGESVDTHIQDIHLVNASSSDDIPSSSVGHDFGTVDIGTSSAVTFRIENLGNDDLRVDGIGLIGDLTNFRIGNAPSTPGILTPGASVSFEVHYAPSTAAEHTTFIQIANNDPDTAEQLYVIELKGVGREPGKPDIALRRGGRAISNNGTYYFNDDDDAVEWPGSISRTFTISNTGTADLSITGLLIVNGDADDFSSDLATPVSIAPGGERSFTITFDPARPQQEEELRSARLQIINSDSDENPYKVDLYGWVEYDD
jgi:hypothetical protein